MVEQPKPTFSESWHRVAGQRILLRPAIEIQRQFYRGERWYVVHNRFNNEFFRLSPGAYELLIRLEGRTVEEAWQQSLSVDPDGAPTQDEVIQLLAQLYHANLLRSALPANTSELFARYKKRRTKELRSRFLNLFSIQIPLWDPDDFLRRALPWVRPLFGKFGAVLWILVVGAALKMAADHWPELWDQADGVIAPGNLALLYLALALIKAIHELGHAFACRRFGGEVHKLGILLLFFSPVPYVDATSSWAFRSKWQRILVASAGMIVELFVAAIAMFVWANTAPGLVHSLAYNVIFIASVTTILFNANPLLRYDGYYILSDLLEFPNLAGRSGAYTKYLAERYLFGLRQPTPARTRQEAVILTTYGVLSWAYRIVLFAGIALFLANNYLVLGLLMVAVCVLNWTVLPLWRFLQYLATSPRLGQQRTRAVGVSVGGFAALLIGLATIPAPNHFRAPGIVQSEAYADIFAGAPGYLHKVVVPSGRRVAAGEPLIELQNKELDLRLGALEAEAKASRVALARAVESRAAEIRALEDRIASLEQQIGHLRELKSKLVVRAPHAGTWACGNTEELVGTWIMRGAMLGKVLDDSRFEFSAIVPQTEAAGLFTRAIMYAEVRLPGQVHLPLRVTEHRIVPANRQQLPSAALGWRGGGDIPVSAADPDGLRTEEPFFELRGLLAPREGSALYHGCSGKIRFTLQPEPLLFQWERKLRQLFQRHFQS